MEQLNKNRIQEYIALKNPEEMKGLLIASLIINFAFPFMLFGFSLQLKINVFNSAWGVFYIFYGTLIIWNIVIRNNLYKNQINILLYNGISGFVYALEFLFLFYAFGKNVARIDTKYLVVSLIGVIVVIVVLFYYRIKVYKGLVKARSGSPNYAIIITIALFGGIMGKGILSGVPKHAEDVIISIICLVVGCGMVLSTTSIHQYYVASKYKDQIKLFEKPKVKTKNR